MSNFKALSARETALLLLEIKNPIVFIHPRPDGDAVGSGSALCEIYRQLGVECKIISEDKIPDRLDFITEFCDISVAEKVGNETAIAIDCASVAQLGALADFKMPTLMIDHHAIGEVFADNYIVSDASSSAEVLLDIIDELILMNKISMTNRLAYALYTAISSDTGCFAFSNTSKKTHLRAAELLSLGIDTADINHKLFYSKSENIIKAEGFTSSNIETYADGRVAVSAVTLADMEKLGLTYSDFETSIDIVRSLNNVEIALSIKETKENIYKVSLRSTGANVAEIAKNFGGGGHIRAAGCTIAAENIDIVKELIISHIPNRLE